MARSFEDVLKRARELLQDDEGVRYTTPQLMAHAIDALELVRELRPDIFIGRLSVPLADWYEVTDFLPVPDNLFPAIGAYVAGAAEMRDDEFAIDGRAMTMKESLAKRLLTGS